MKSRIFNLLLLVTITILVWLILFSPLNLGEPASIQAESIQSGQESFVRALQSGIFYEKIGESEQAKTQYETAAGAQQAEIAQAAATNLQRLVLQGQNLWLKLRTSLQDSVWKITELAVMLCFAILIILIAWQLVNLLPLRPGYLMLPFEDSTPDSAGKLFHTLVYRQLTHIRQTHQDAQGEMFSDLERLDLPLISPEWDVPVDVLASLDSTRIGEINLPLGGAIQAIKKWQNRREYTIRGSVDQTGSALHITVQLVQTRDQQVLHEWEIKPPVEGDTAGQIFTAASETAYRLLYFLCQDQVKARNWNSFRLFTQGLHEMQLGQDASLKPELLEQSMATFQDCIRQDPGYLLPQFVLGMLEVNRGQYSSAQEVFSRVLEWSEENQPLQLACRYNLGLTSYHSYTNEGYSKSSELFSGLVAYFAKKPPRDERLQALLALSYCGLAAVEAQRLRPLIRERVVPETSREKELQRYCDAAILTAEKRKDVQAIVHFAQGVLALARGKHEQAISEFRQSVQSRPDYIEGYIYLAIAKYEMGDSNEAIRLLRLTEQQKLPGNEYAMYRLGEIYRELEQTDAAQKVYELAPNVPEAQVALAQLLLSQGKRLAAYEHFRAAANLTSRRSEYWEQAALCVLHPDLLDAALLPEAIQAASRMQSLVQGKPEEWKSRDLLGLGYSCQGDGERAIKELLVSTKIEEHKQNLYHLARVYFEGGNLVKARETNIRAFQVEEDAKEWQELAKELMRKIEAAEASAPGTPDQPPQG